MTREELLEKHKDLCDRARDLMRAKNEDYAGSNEPFANFQLVEHLGVMDTGKAIFARFLDKVRRISTYLIRGEYSVAKESFEDSILDGINYLILLYCWVVAPKPEMAPGNEPVKSNLDEVLAEMEVDADGFLAVPDSDIHDVPWSVLRSEVFNTPTGRACRAGRCVHDLATFLKSKGWNGVLPPE